MADLCAPIHIAGDNQPSGMVCIQRFSDAEMAVFLVYVSGGVDEYAARQPPKARARLALRGESRILPFTSLFEGTG